MYKFELRFEMKLQMLLEQIKELISYTQKLDHQVVSCEEAAAAKGIPLVNELKSLVLETSKGLCIVHIPGNKCLDLRKVKTFLNTDEACLASKEVLTALGVQPGTVTPFSNNIWDLKQLVSEEILSFKFISTNNGRLDEYIIFSPTLLLKIPNIYIGNFNR